MSFAERWKAGLFTVAIVGVSAFLGAGVGVLIIGLPILVAEILFDLQIGQWWEIGCLLGWAIFTPWMVSEALQPKVQDENSN